jgi:CheY-like chemotaxis protein
MATVLVVEDDEASLLLAAAILERLGHHAAVARSAEEATAVLRERRPALVLMDVRLPGQDGLTLTRRLKADPLTASVPVVALTAHARPSDREEALAAGCVAWITKPVDTRLLARTVERLLA